MKLPTLMLPTYITMIPTLDTLDIHLLCILWFSSINQSVFTFTFLLQVSKKLEKTARHFKNLGTLGFWSQLVCTFVSAGILSFSAVATGNVTAPFTFCATAVGIVMAFISVFQSYGYIRLSERLKRTANEPSKVLTSPKIVVKLQYYFFFSVEQNISSVHHTPLSLWYLHHLTPVYSASCPHLDLTPISTLLVAIWHNLLNLLEVKVARIYLWFKLNKNRNQTPKNNSFILLLHGGLAKMSQN